MTMKSSSSSFSSSSSSNSSSTNVLSVSDQQQLIEKLDIFKIQGRDKRGLVVLRILGKHFPAKLVSVEALKRYLEEKIFSKLSEQPFCVVYVDAGVQRGDNFPGISTLRSIYEAIPITVKDHLESVYFLHPGLQSRLFLATFGRFIFNGGFYGKLKYVSRLEFLWDHVRRDGMEMPEYVYDHDEELEYRPTMDYGMESDHPNLKFYCAPAVDSSFSMYSMRCIA